MKDWKRETTIYKEALKKLARDIKRQIRCMENGSIDGPDLDDMVCNDIDIAKVYYHGAEKRLVKRGKI